MEKILLLGLTLLSPALLGGWQETKSQTNSLLAQESTEMGSLSLVANGEDFVRQGFVTKDGWQINFEHVYVTLADVIAYETDPPFDPDTGENIQPQQTVILVETPQTIDLAAGETDAPPIVVNTVEAPAGQYNALSWKVIPAATEPGAGNNITLQGTATKDEEKIDFVIGFNQNLEYVCGEFVGEERKGIVKVGGEAEVETTLHFDHIFGDGEVAAEEEINTGALGFAPLAALATEGKLAVNMTTLQEKLTSEDYEKLSKAIAGLGHVGEGHCKFSEQ